MKNILFLLKGSLDNAVPIISIAMALNSEKVKVKVICGNISSGLKNELENSGITVCSLEISTHLPCGLLKYIIKLKYWILFRYRAKNELLKESPDFLYVATADTAIALHGVFEMKYKYFLHLRELYDQFPIYMKLLRTPARNAYKVIVPEENRAYIYYSIFKLQTVPTVIPNKPFYHPRMQKMDISFLDESIQAKIKSKKNIIYQGHLHKERDISKIVDISNRLPEYNLIMLGNDQGMLERYFKINPDIIHIPFVRPPLHLNITSWGYIGIISYDFNSLNTIYCAPNKTWEYTGFGIPILGNHNPGLKYSIEKYFAGVIIDMDNGNEILDSINELDKNHAYYSKNALVFFDSFNMAKKVGSLLED